MRRVRYPRGQIDNKVASFEMALSEVTPYMVILCEFISFNLILSCKIGSDLISHDIRSDGSDITFT